MIPASPCRCARALPGFFVTLIGFPVVVAAADPAVPVDVVKWTREHAMPLKTVEAGNGFADLEPLRAAIGGARIVALGEPTHGSREVFQLKHRLLEFLASEMGFTIFAIEANMPEARRVNDYVADGKGDPVDLIRGMYFWTWSTEEVRAMVEWMRGFNLDQKNQRAGRRVEFTGFDMQYPKVAAQIVREFVAPRDADLLAKVDEAIAVVPKLGVGSHSFGFATGSFPADRARGHRIVFSGWIKTAEVSGGAANLWWRADRPDKSASVFRNTATAGLSGTKDWQRYEITIDVPEDTVHINYGATLSGRGRAWFDDLVVTIDGVPFEEGAELDYGFEGSEINTFNVARAGSGYETRLDANPHSGKQSLLIESEPPKPEPRTNVRESWRAIETQLAKFQSGLTERNETTAAAWAVQNAHIVNQYLAMDRNGGESRDASMAENVAWLLAQNSNAKIVLWAHNGHVQRSERSMGGYIAKRVKDEMVVVGFATGKGGYRAVSRKRSGLGEFPLTEPPPTSVEAVFAAARQPRFVLDLRPARDGGDGRWFAEAHDHRSIGAMEMTQQFFPHTIARDYDLIAWIEETSPAVGLGK